MTEPLDTLAQLESALWAQGFDQPIWQQLSARYRQLEQQLSPSEQTHRHPFIITIPVADRPQHLRSCLQSLLTLCQTFHYGGVEQGRYSKVSVLIADDSRDPANIAQQQQIAHEFSALGLICDYFGQNEQLRLIKQLPAPLRTQLEAITGPLDPQQFGHKGASITRNIAYLKLQQLCAQQPNSLCYFVDSDQEFQITFNDHDGDHEAYAINYLFHLDRLFRDHPIEILTGKVVGDPPVSPAVMAGNFLQDVSGFLEQVSALPAAQPCSFHHYEQRPADDASYHDMAELFGFQQRPQSFQFHCRIEGHHNHLDCYRRFAEQLGHFFDGEHPTRKTYFEPSQPIEQLAPARTIYTGNYVFRASALRHFIPFAPLKLRMAGPVLGRLIKAEIGAQFVSAHLPMLHRRTVASSGRAEFRAGVEHQQQQVDLGVEFERQYFGDVMLFSIEKLTALGYPTQWLASEQIRAVVEATEAELRDKYATRQQLIRERLLQLKTRFNDPKQWWQQQPELDDANHQLQQFIANIEANFIAPAIGLQQIRDPAHRQQRLQQIRAAIGHYRQDRQQWQQLLDGLTTSPKESDRV